MLAVSGKKIESASYLVEILSDRRLSRIIKLEVRR